jgi:hypothetical protein
LGDNGVGAWGDDCTEGSGPSVALPPEVREYYGLRPHDKIVVEYHGKEVVAEIKDTMPHIGYLERKGLKARIDMNPDTCKALDLEPPVMALVTWRKLDE